MNIKQALEAEVSQWGQVGHPALVQRFVLAKGRLMKAASNQLPDDVRPGIQKECFMNATRLAYEGYRYVEGYAMSKTLNMLIHHAWVLDGDDNVIDNTWQSPVDCQYFGVEFELEEVAEETDKSGVYGLLDHGIGINVELICKNAPELKEVLEGFKTRLRGVFA